MAKTAINDDLSADLIESWKIISVYNGVPRLFTDQTALIKSRYGNIVQGRQVSQMHPAQAFRLAQSVYERAIRSTQDLNREDKQVMPTLAAYRTALMQRTANRPLTNCAQSMESLANLDTRIENLEERIAMQLDACNIRDDSPVIAVYNNLQAVYGRKESLINQS